MSTIFIGGSVISVPGTSKMYGVGGVVFGVNRLPTDPLFYADVTLQNVTDGSECRISMHNSPYTELALRSQTGTEDIVISGVPAYANPMLMDITVRNFNGTSKYKEYNTNASLVKSGTLVYVVQSIDPTA